MPTAQNPSLSARLQRLASEVAGARRVTDVRIGLSYTACLLDDGGCGVALTFHEAHRCNCEALELAGTLSGRSATELLGYLTSPHPIEAAVALSCANALLNRQAPEQLPGDVLEHLELRAEDRVAMVGHFQPLLERLRAQVAELLIFERHPEPGGDLLPAEAAASHLPRCQVALLTATTLLNGTLDGLLAAASACREVVLLGASTPLAAAAFRDTPVTALSGVLVTDPAAVRRIVSEGGGMRRFRGLIQKVNLKLDR